jgi:DNA polymerase III sliding clamp (beta) subunit (PCNA family)
MIKFNIQTADLKYIMAALRPAVPKTDCKPVHQYIKFECSDEKLSAYAVDGYRIHSVTVHVDITDGEKAFCFLLKPFMAPKTDSEFIPCELSEKEIMFNFGEQKITFKLGTGIENFVDIHAAIPTKPAVLRIGFNPKFLVDAAKTLQKNSRTPLIMEFRNPLDPVIIYSDKDKSDFRIVLPVRMRSEVDPGTAFKKDGDKS